MTAAEIARQVRAGALSPVEVVEACLKRIEEVDPSVLAWVHVDRAGALETARKLEAESRAGQFRGPLHGVPVGIKDIIGVAGMITTNGSGEFAHERPGADATCVAKLKAAGAVILGKTATTQFASGDPAPTRNPWNLEHTPGGSSSGSAAGVASGMMPLALGTQTGGSVLRPAAYCGIVGLKPTHGRISTAGVTPLAWSLDHVGVFARNVESACARARSAGRARRRGSAVGERPTTAACVLRSCPAHGPRGSEFLDGSTPTERARGEPPSRDRRIDLRPKGRLDPRRAPHRIGRDVQDAHALMMRVEAAAYHRERFARPPRFLPALHPPIVDEGLETSASSTRVPFDLQKEFRRDMTRSPSRGSTRSSCPSRRPRLPRDSNRPATPDSAFPEASRDSLRSRFPADWAETGCLSRFSSSPVAFAEPGLLAAALWCEDALAFRGCRRSRQRAKSRGSIPFPSSNEAPTAPTRQRSRSRPALSLRRNTASIPVQCAPRRFSSPISRSFVSVQRRCSGDARKRWNPPRAAWIGASFTVFRAYSRVLMIPAWPHPEITTRPESVSITSDWSLGRVSSPAGNAFLESTADVASTGEGTAPPPAFLQARRSP